VVALQSVLREFDFSYLTAERAARLRMPILLVWGAYDRTVPVDLGRSLARALPTSEFHVIGRSWHRPHVERPAEVASLIFGFLRRLPGSKELEGH
jgi:pimeloyl-ACP methyl ester carboxylesterase